MAGRNNNRWSNVAMKSKHVTYLMKMINRLENVAGPGASSGVPSSAGGPASEGAPSSIIFSDGVSINNDSGIAAYDGTLYVATSSTNEIHAYDEATGVLLNSWSTHSGRGVMKLCIATASSYSGLSLYAIEKDATGFFVGTLQEYSLTGTWIAQCSSSLAPAFAATDMHGTFGATVSYGHLLVCDATNDYIRVYRINVRSSGTSFTISLIRNIGTSGVGDGQFTQPQAAVLYDYEVFALDARWTSAPFTTRLQVFDIRTGAFKRKTGSLGSTAYSLAINTSTRELYVMGQGLPTSGSYGGIAVSIDDGTILRSISSSQATRSCCYDGYLNALYSLVDPLYFQRFPVTNPIPFTEYVSTAIVGTTSMFLSSGGGQTGARFASDDTIVILSPQLGDYRIITTDALGNIIDTNSSAIKQGVGVYAGDDDQAYVVNFNEGSGDTTHFSVYVYPKDLSSQNAITLSKLSTETVGAIGADSAGNFYVAFTHATTKSLCGIRKYNSAGVLQATTYGFDGATGFDVRTIYIDNVNGVLYAGGGYRAGTWGAGLWSYNLATGANTHTIVDIVGTPKAIDGRPADSALFLFINDPSTGVPVQNFVRRYNLALSQQDSFTLPKTLGLRRGGCYTVGGIAAAALNSVILVTDVAEPSLTSSSYGSLALMEVDMTAVGGSGGTGGNQTTWYHRTKGGIQLSMGEPDTGVNVPDLKALENPVPSTELTDDSVSHLAGGYLIQIREALTKIVTAGKLNNPKTGAVYNLDQGDSANNVYYVAMSPQMANYGLSGESLYSWARPLSKTQTEYYDVDIGELWRVTETLWDAARIQGLI